MTVRVVLLKTETTQPFESCLPWKRKATRSLVRVKNQVQFPDVLLNTFCFFLIGPQWNASPSHLLTRQPIVSFLTCFPSQLAFLFTGVCHLGPPADQMLGKWLDKDEAEVVGGNWSQNHKTGGLQRHLEGLRAHGWFTVERRELGVF